MTVQRERLRVGQEGIVIVQVRPAGLDHARIGPGEQRSDGPAQEVGFRPEVRVKDGRELGVHLRQAPGQRPRLEAGAVSPVQHADIGAICAMLGSRRLRNGGRVVGRIVEHLDHEAVPGVVEVHRRCNQPLDHVAFVEDGQLDDDCRPLIFRRGDRWAARAAVAEVQQGQRKGLKPVQAQPQRDDRIQCNEQNASLLSPMQGQIKGDRPASVDQRRVAMCPIDATLYVFVPTGPKRNADDADGERFAGFSSEILLIFPHLRHLR